DHPDRDRPARHQPRRRSGKPSARNPPSRLGVHDKSRSMARQERFPRKDAVGLAAVACRSCRARSHRRGFQRWQNERDRKQEADRAKSELDIAADGRRENALTAYLQRMEELTLQHRLTAHPSYDVVLLARTLTLAVLRRLDGQRKRQVIEFLSDAGL